jgi:glutamyl/glutaminyl-tRNA synthetase
VIGVIAGNRFYAVGALAMYLMDLMNGITCAIRGVDIASIVAATQAVGGRIAAGLPETLLIGIVRDSNGAKLSKSAGAEGVLVLRDKAIFPERVLNNVFRSLNPHAGHGRGLSLGQMIDQFDLRQAPEYDVRVGADGLINLRAVRAREK